MTKLIIKYTISTLLLIIHSFVKQNKQYKFVFKIIY